MRVVSDTGDLLGVMATGEALRLVEEAGLDLVEVAPEAQPPVTRMMDYRRFKNEATTQKDYIICYKSVPPHGKVVKQNFREVKVSQEIIASTSVFAFLKFVSLTIPETSLA